MDNERDKELGLITAYAQKYWDAGNILITLMFGVAFGIYYLAVQHKGVRDLIDQYCYEVLIVSAIGNIALAIVLWRFAVNERVLIRKITADEMVIEAIWSGVELRWGLLAGNFFMYVLVIGLIAQYTP